MTKTQLAQIEGHTPGPWRIYFGKSPTEEPGFNAKQIRANSLLLSYSPRILEERAKLLSSLRLCIARLEEYGDAEGGTALELARAAIAFAESE